MAPESPEIQEKQAAEMRSPRAEKTETGDIKKSLFTLLFIRLILTEDIEMSDMKYEKTDQDGEDDSRPELREVESIC